MSNYTIAWILWGLIFLAIEGIALADKDEGDTLSEHIWRWFKVRGAIPTKTGWTLRLILAGFMVWLSGHMIFGWWS
jgi:hypothetical protein